MRAGRKPPEALTGPEIPDEVAYLWQWFCELDLARRYGKLGPDPISYSEIGAWAALTDRQPLPHEVEALVMIDLAMRSVAAESRTDTAGGGRG